MTLEKYIEENGEIVDVSKIKLKLPGDVLTCFVAYGGGREEMYLAGPMMGDWWLSDKPSGDRQLFPFPPEVSPQDTLNWEVA